MPVTHYLHDALMISRRNKTVDFILKKLENVDYDSIVVSGVSGTLIGSIVSFLTGKNLIVVRKRNDDSHSKYDIESSSKKCKKYIILDDQIGYGGTVRRMLEKMEDSNYFGDTKCVSILVYSLSPDNVQVSSFNDYADLKIPVIRRTNRTKRFRKKR